MKRGFIISSVMLIFAFAVVVATFSFVLSENELHNSAVTGLAVEKARWVADAKDYNCFKLVNSSVGLTLPYQSQATTWSDEGEDLFNDNFLMTTGLFYNRSSGSNKTLFTNRVPLGYLDFFEKYHGFNISYIYNTPPRIRLSDPEDSDVLVLTGLAYDFTVRTCDTDDALSTLEYTLEYGISPVPVGWSFLEDNSGTPIDHTTVTDLAAIPVNFSETGIAGFGNQYCFRAMVTDDDGKDSLYSIVCDVTVP